MQDFDLKKETKRKFDSIDLLGQMNQVNLGNTDALFTSNGTQMNVNKEEIQRMINQSIPKLSLDEEKYKKLQKDLNEIHYKVETANEIEKRVMRLFKEVDINSLVKQVKLKMNTEEYRKELTLIDSRINQLSEQQSFLRRDCDNVVQLVKKQITQASGLTITNNFMQTDGFQTPNSSNQLVNSLLSTKKLIPIKQCLSCNQNRGQSNAHERFQSIGKNPLNESSDLCYTSPDDNRLLNLSSTNGNNILHTPNKRVSYMNRRIIPSPMEIRNRPISAVKK